MLNCNKNRKNFSVKRLISLLLVINLAFAIITPALTIQEPNSTRQDLLQSILDADLGAVSITEALQITQSSAVFNYEISDSIAETTEDELKIDFANSGIEIEYILPNDQSNLSEHDTITDQSTQQSNMIAPTSATLSAAEMVRYGQSAVNLSGNLSRTYIDMSVTAPGFDLMFSRTYNSRDDRTTGNIISRGWTFGFQGKIDEAGNDAMVRLPNGAAMSFTNNANGTYTAKDSRSTLVKSGSGTNVTYTLTTKDQYVYMYNASGYMTAMADRNGNTVTITVDSAGKPTTVLDQAGRTFTIAYLNNRISTITDPVGRVVSYIYNTSNYLSRVTDPTGRHFNYEYDADGYLIRIRDHNNNALESFTYKTPPGETLKRLKTETNSFFNTFTYVYDKIANSLRSTDSNNRRVTTTLFDKELYPVQVTDAGGRVSRTGYNLDNGINRWGETRMVTDRNGNTTYYDRDQQGNVTRIVNPDGSTRHYTYDNKNNITSEKDEMGKSTFYVYDANGVNLIRKAQPLNGTTPYTTSTNQSLFAIENYSYYTATEADAMCGRTIHGLLKSVTNAENQTTTYTYDQRGYLARSRNPLNRDIITQYNIIGWLQQETTPKGYTTKYYYDKNGRLLKKILHGNETERYVYDMLGNLTQTISPRQYSAASDTTTFTAANIVNTTGAYSANTHGIRMTYYISGLVNTVTDAMNNVWSYTYDQYGNVLTERLPNDGVNVFAYDTMNRVTFTLFRDTATAGAITLETNAYTILQNRQTQIVTTQHLSGTQSAVTTVITDWAGRVVSTQKPDGAVMSSVYNANGTKASDTNERGFITTYAYDGLNRLAGQWSPADNGFEYSGIEYDNTGRVTRSTQGRGKVAQGTVPTDVIWTNYTYNADGTVSQTTDSAGGKTTFAYDMDGYISQQNEFTSATEYVRTAFSYNHRRLLTEKLLIVKQRDINGLAENDEETALTTNYQYDLDGNLTRETDPMSIATNYTYDLLGRRISESRMGTNENGISVNITASQTYDFRGNVLTATDALNRTTAYQYDRRGRLIRVTDPSYGITIYEYNRAGLVTAEVLPNHFSTRAINTLNRTEYEYDLCGRVIRKVQRYIVTNTWTEATTVGYIYDLQGNVIKFVDAMGYAEASGSTVSAKLSSAYGTEYTYDPQGRLLTMRDAETALKGLSFTQKFEYDGAGRKINETDANNNITIYTYNDAGYVLIVTAGADVIQSYTYDLSGNPLTATDALGAVATYTYNAWGLVRSVTLPAAASVPSYTVTNRYDRLGRLVLQTDSMQKQTLNTYDNFGRLLTQTERHSNGTQAIIVSQRYDINGNLRSTTDGNGNQTSFTYDALDRLLTSTAGTKTTTLTYDKNGNKLTEKDWRGNIITYTYDPLDRLVQITDPYGNIIEQLTYNHSGSQITSKDALGHVTTFGYDRNQRQTSRKDTMQYTETVTYDNRGNVYSVTDANGNSKFNFYDRFNRLIRVESPLGTILSNYTYDLAGNMLTQNIGGMITYNTYNTRGLLISRRIGDTSNPSETYTYFGNGMPATYTDRNGVTFTYTYDIHGRLTSKQASSGESVSYTYDSNGNELTMTDSTGTTTRTYDAQNRVLTKNTPNIGTSTFTYDIIAGVGTGHTAERSSDPRNNITTKEYDRLGREYRITSSAGTATYTYNSNGSVQRLTYPGGAYEEYTYYANNRLHTLSNRLPNGTIIDAYNYAYDAAGNQTQILDATGTTSYEYDNLNRLKKSIEPDGRVTEYTYDAAGNRVTEKVTVSGQATNKTYAYGDQNRLTKVTTINHDGHTLENALTYDKNGNLLGSLVSGLTAAGSTPATLTLSVTDALSSVYSYDVWNNQTSAYKNGNTVYSAYNGYGLRVSKTTKGLTSRYLYEYSDVVLELNGSGAQTAFMVYGTMLLTRNGQSLMRNGHGDVTAIVSGNTVVASYYYDAFGNHRSITGASTNPYRYSGYHFDSETGLYYLKARMYDPEIAWFLQEDSFRGWITDPLSLNLYTYAHNNPIKYYDPTGHYVSPTDRANLTSSQISRLEQLTKDWNAANASGNTAAMNAAKKEGEAIRATAGYSGGNNGNQITVSSGDTVRTVVTNATTTVTNSGTINTVNVLTGSTGTINNSGSIGTINNSGTIRSISNTGSIGTINNSGTIGTVTNTGTIRTVSNSNTISNLNNSGTVRTVSNSGTITNININSSGSIGTISNSNIINSIVVGQNSSATIGNVGLINSIITDSGSAIKVNNSGLIENISIGSNGVLEGNNAGYVANVFIGAGGKSTSQWNTTSAAPMLQMQNQFILDYLLTQEEQAAGVGASRIGESLYRDISDPVTNALARDVWEFEQRRGNGIFDNTPWRFIDNSIWFAGMVGDEGRWNLKYLDPETNKRRWETTLGIPFWDYSTQMVLNGMIVTVEDVGNITYGYLGTAIGFDQSYLKTGSSANHAKNHLWRNWDNEYKDHAAIAIGINWYKVGVMK